MRDLISRDKAIEVVNKIACGSFDGDLSHIASDIEDALLEMPPADIGEKQIKDYAKQYGYVVMDENLLRYMHGGNVGE